MKTVLHVKAFAVFSFQPAEPFIWCVCVCACIYDVGLVSPALKSFSHRHLKTACSVFWIFSRSFSDTPEDLRPDINYWRLMWHCVQWSTTGSLKEVQGWNPFQTCRLSGRSSAAQLVLTGVSRPGVTPSWCDWICWDQWFCDVTSILRKEFLNKPVWNCLSSYWRLQTSF